MKRLLICVPTCNRAGMVREVLEYELNYYKGYDFDLLYYDSSTDTKTKQVIDEISRKCQFEIQYKKCLSQLCLDYKLVRLLQSIDKYRYDYIWQISDSISIRSEAMDVILPLLDEGYDLIRLPLAGAGYKEDVICNTQQEWFEKCSQGMAHMASTIMGTSLLRCEQIDWDFLTQKYIATNDLDDSHGYFFMVAFYLEQILKLKEFRGLMIGNRIKWRRDSPLKGTQSYWNEKIFDVWIRSYCETIEELPDYYQNKEKVIRYSDNCVVGRFSGTMLARYRLDGLYNFTTYRKHCKKMPLVTNTSPWICALIACVPKIILKYIVLKNRVPEEKWAENLEKICADIGNKNVIIYGAGLYGERVAETMRLKTKNSLIGIAVTDKQENINEINGINVYGIDELVNYRDSAVIIIATLPNAARQIRRELKRRGFRDYIALLGY